jgi:hypothetical protein
MSCKHSPRLPVQDSIEAHQSCAKSLPDEARAGPRYRLAPLLLIALCLFGRVLSLLVPVPASRRRRYYRKAYGHGVHSPEHAL